jgi:hypothetical protein
MPRIDTGDDLETHKIAGSSFSFKGARIESLGATEYTLVTIAVDVTGSTAEFADELRSMLITAVESCQKSPRRDNLLLRVITFSTAVGGVNELHGFKLLRDIKPSDYPQFRPDGMTPLFDATFSVVGAMVQYGEELVAQDFNVNGILFVITDGYDNQSRTTPKMIAEQVAKTRKEESIESLVSVLIGINVGDYASELEKFRRLAALDRVCQPVGVVAESGVGDGGRVDGDFGVHLIGSS